MNNPTSMQYSGHLELLPEVHKRGTGWYLARLHGRPACESGTIECSSPFHRHPLVITREAEKPTISSMASTLSQEFRKWNGTWSAHHSEIALGVGRLQQTESIRREAAVPAECLSLTGVTALRRQWDVPRQ